MKIRNKIQAALLEILDGKRRNFLRKSGGGGGEREREGEREEGGREREGEIGKVKFMLT